MIERLPAEVDTIYLANPSLSRAEIMQAIAEELDSDVPTVRRWITGVKE
jgi:hypothetical protein